LATTTFSNSEFAALLSESTTTPKRCTGTTTNTTKSNETAAGGERTAMGVQHHQSQEQQSNKELSNHQAAKGGPSTAEGVADAHQKALKAAAVEQIQQKAKQELWEAVTRYERAPQQQDLWEGACTTALQQMAEEFSPLLTTSFEVYYLCTVPVGQILVVSEARRRADEILKFRCKKHRQRNARAARKFNQCSQHHSEVL